MGESRKQALRVSFDGRLKLEFHGANITSDAGLLAYRELDEALDADDVAGETYQDRCKGGAPCAAGDLPDGGSGNPTGIVPSEPGADWTTEVARHGQWMNDKQMNTSVTTGELSLPPGQAAVWRVRIGEPHGASLNNTVLVLENGLKALCDGRKIVCRQGKLTLTP